MVAETPTESAANTSRPAGRLAKRESEAFVVARLRAPGADGLLSADYVVERIGELYDTRGTYVADVGQNQMWLARYTGFASRTSHVTLRRPRARWASASGAMGAGPRADRPRDLGRSPATAVSR
jgi:thiamine pyrophosphate-dependent acetolactate synthase large subunit-like protein